MKSAPPGRLQAFLFAPVSALPLGLLRIGWALSTLWIFAWRAPDMVRLYGDDGLLPRELAPLLLRDEYRWTILSFSGDARFVVAVSVVFGLALLCMLLGLRTRVTTVIAVLLSYSFIERNTLTVGGGDALLRSIGFLLMLAPGIQALSLDRLLLQRAGATSRAALSPATTPVWTRRFLLWQVVLLYVFSWWSKLLGTAWITGMAPAIVLSDPTYARFPVEIVGAWLPVVSVSISVIVLLYEPLWLVMLLPDRLAGGKVRRCLLIAGALFHVGIAVFLRVGSFLPAMLTAYAGLLRGEDMSTVKRLWRRIIASRNQSR